MSRGGAGSKDWPFAATALHSHFGPFERHFTTGPGEASLVAQSEAESGRRLLLTFGGDGTISETARGIIASKTNCELGVLPHGTGGDFVRSLSIPKRFADAVCVGIFECLDSSSVAFLTGYDDLEDCQEDQEAAILNTAGYDAWEEDEADFDEDSARSCLEEIVEIREDSAPPNIDELSKIHSIVTSEYPNDWLS